MREGLPDVPNHFSPDSLTSHLRIEYPNIVDLDVVSVGYHPADSVRNELREVEPAWLVTDWEEPLAVRHCGRLALVCLLSLMYLLLHSHISLRSLVMLKWWPYPESNRNLKLRRQLCLILLHHTASVPRSNGSDRAESDCDAEVQ